MRRRNMIKKHSKVLSATTRSPMQDAGPYGTAEAEELEAEEQPLERSQQYEPHRVLVPPGLHRLQH